MIISKDTNPEKDLYYLGAKIIEELASTDSDEVDYIELLHKIKSKIQLSNNLYALSLDWLYLIGAIDLSNKGNIRKCF